MMRISLLDEHVAIETTHLADGEDSDAAERACRHVEHLALSDIRAQIALRVTLQTIECDWAGSDVALQSATGEVGSAAVLEQTVLDELIFDGTGRTHLALRSVAAVEAHEGVCELVVVFAGDILVVDIFRHGVVDVEQSHRVVRSTDADEL